MNNPNDINFWFLNTREFKTDNFKRKALKIVRICFLVIIVTPTFIRLLNFTMPSNGLGKKERLKWIIPKCYL